MGDIITKRAREIKIYYYSHEQKIGHRAFDFLIVELTRARKKLANAESVSSTWHIECADKGCQYKKQKTK